MHSEQIFCRSRKRAIATGSGPAWQGPETLAAGPVRAVLVVIPRCAIAHLGARLGANPESPAVSSGFRVRSRCESPGMTDGALRPRPLVADAQQFHPPGRH